jgi:trehalose-6-phosphatase
MKLISTTPHGKFDRTTQTAYTHIVVRSCERSQRIFDDANNGVQYFAGGVQGRWVKDRGFAVTWHKGEAAARTAASKPYVWAKSTVLGIYPVDAS